MTANRPRIILASSSPRRRELLREAGYEFDIHPPRDGAECGLCSGETPPEFVARQACQKAQDVAERLAAATSAKANADARLVLGCDTVAECQGRILGKPSDERHARDMLETLNGAEHRVYSGVCLWPLDGGQPSVRVAVTVLRMDRLSRDQIEEYLASGLWEGKAGAFGYQDRVGWLHIVTGSESNVVGLPLETLAEMLE